MVNITHDVPEASKKVDGFRHNNYRKVSLIILSKMKKIGVVVTHRHDKPGSECSIPLSSILG